MTTLSKTIVVLQNDPTLAQKLVSAIKAVSNDVFVVRSVAELETLAAQLRIEVGVLDLDAVTLREIAQLKERLGIAVVCTHRRADDAMWTNALGAGALDCCFDDDATAICRAIQMGTDPPQGLRNSTRLSHF